MEKSEADKLTLTGVSLCGVTGLCDVLPELSFPTPLPSTHEKSLLFRQVLTCKVSLITSYLTAHDYTNYTYTTVVNTQWDTHTGF